MYTEDCPPPVSFPCPSRPEVIYKLHSTVEGEDNLEYFRLEQKMVVIEDKKRRKNRTWRCACPYYGRKCNRKYCFKKKFFSKIVLNFSLYRMALRVVARPGLPNVYYIYSHGEHRENQYGKTPTDKV